MLSIQSLTFNNIATFIEEQTVDFTKFDKLVQVNGQNLDTGGGSGAAKSSVFHAQDYLFGINDIPATALQSRLTKDPLYVEGSYIADGIPLKIKRCKKTGLTIKYGDETVSGNVKLAEERLWEIIGIPKKLFKKMIHKKQKEGGFFLNLTAKESYEFLMTSLGLEDTIKKSYKIDSGIKILKAEIEKLDQAIELKTNSLKDLKGLRDLQKEPTNDVDASGLEILRKEIEVLSNNVNVSTAKRDSDISSILGEKPVKPSPIASSENDEKFKQYNDEIEKHKEEIAKIAMVSAENNAKLDQAKNSINKELNAIPHHNKTINSLVVDINEAIDQKSHLEDNKCPTCSQQWSDEGALAKIQELSSKIEESKEKILSLKTIVDQQSTLEEKLAIVNKTYVEVDGKEEIDAINKKVNEINQKIVELKSSEQNQNSIIENKYLKELNEYNTKVNDIESKHKDEVSTLKSNISEKQNLINSIEGKMSNYTRSLEDYKGRIVEFDTKIEESSKELKLDVEQLESSKYDLMVAEEAKRALKSYTLQVFQDTLDYIGSYATEILSDIPNMQNTTIYFEGCKENKSGTIKDEVNAIVNVCGYDKVNIKTLSGGERTAIDLAVDLAVIDMIESKAGKGADFFILDEPFNGLEDINISQCLEVLKQIDTNKKIIIVDHNPIAKEMIEDGITIVKENGQSVVL